MRSGRWLGAALILAAVAAARPAVGSPPAQNTEESAEPLATPAGAARLVSYLAIFVVVGACILPAIALRVPEDIPGATALRATIENSSRSVGLGGAGALVAADAARLYLQARDFLDPGGSLWEDAMAPVLFHTAWGRGWQLQLGAAIASLAILVLASRDGRLWPWRSAAVVGLVLTAPLTGHAVADSWDPWLAVPLQAAHLLGGAAWLGTLGVLVGVGLTAARRAPEGEHPELVAALVGRFSPVALWGAGVAVSSGGLLAFSYFPAPSGLWRTSYGLALLAKVGLLLAVAGVGAYNWRRRLPVLAKPGGPTRLRRSAGVELTFAVLLLAVTAVLVALPLPASP